MPTAISAEMGGAGAVDQPEVVGLVILSAPLPLEFAKVAAQGFPPNGAGVLLLKKRRIRRKDLLLKEAKKMSAVCCFSKY
jgi:hypothetical protein